MQASDIHFRFFAGTLLDPCEAAGLWRNSFLGNNGRWDEGCRTCGGEEGAAAGGIVIILLGSEQCRLHLTSNVRPNRLMSLQAQ